MTTLQVIPRKSGTWSLILERDDAPAIIYRTKIPNRAEALHRAAVVAELCGYRVRELIYRG